MRDFLEIDATPAEEDCEQVGDPNYSYEKAIAECRRFAALIVQVCGEPPGGARVSIKRFDHEFGSYHQVVVKFDDEDPDAVDYAFHVESYAPTKWDGSGGKKWEPKPVEDIPDDEVPNEAHC